MQLSFRTTLGSPPSWCSITTVRSSTARTLTCLPSTIVLTAPLTSWLRGGTMLARDTRSTILLIYWLPSGWWAVWSRRNRKCRTEVRAKADFTRPQEFLYRRAGRSRKAGSLSRRAVLLHAQLTRCLAPAAGRFLARQGAYPQGPRGDHHAPTVHDHLGLARGKLDARLALAHPAY